MEQQKFWIAAVVAMTMMVLPFNCFATYITVGGSSEWALGFNYSNWTSGQTFAVGDKLVFKYTPGTHNTLVVNKAAYDACTLTNALATYSSGNDTISLNSTGAKYYICGIPGHCSGGMKLTVTVAAAKSNGTAPSPSPTSKSNGTAPSPSPTSSPPSPSPTSSPPSATPTPPTATSPSPSSGTPPTGTSTGSPPPATTTPPPSGSNNSAAAPSFRLDGALLLAGSLLLAMASL